MTRKQQEKHEQRIERLQSQIFDLKEEIASLKARQALFKPSEWSTREDAAKWEASRNQANDNLAAIGVQWALDNGYPELSGSAKQVTWALTIRRKLVDQLRTELREKHMVQIEPWLKSKDEATWWIDHRPLHPGEHPITSLGINVTIKSSTPEPVQTIPSPATFIPGNGLVH